MSTKLKVVGGLVGITRHETARNRWSITYNERGSLAEDTKCLFGLIHKDEDDEVTHKDCLPSRMKRDHQDVLQLVDQFQKIHVFQQENPYDLVTLTTGDVVSEHILDDLTSAAENVKEMLTDFVTKRLATRSKDFYDTLSKRNSKTFSTSLYSADAKHDKQKTQSAKADRDIFCRIIVEMEW